MHAQREARLFRGRMHSRVASIAPQPQHSSFMPVFLEVAKHLHTFMDM